MPKDTSPRQDRRKAGRSTPTKTNTSQTSDSTLEKRLIRERRVNEALNALDVPLFRVCVEGGPFWSALTHIRVLGSGAFGQVYSAKLPDTPRFVIKEALLTESETKRIQLSREKSMVVRNSYPEEYRIMTLVNDALYSETCPNFLLAYNLAVCEGCRGNAMNICYTAFLEPALGDLSLIGTLTDSVAESCLYQLLAALYWLHTTYGIYHSDIKRENILLLRGEPVGFTTYVVNSVEYKVANVGYVFCLNDFGLSQTFKPAFSGQNYLGTRNAQVINDTSLQPITCQYGLNFSTTRSEPTRVPALNIRWQDGSVSTENRFSTTISPEPNTIVNLNDTKIWPPFEFYLDIQDVLKTIVGGASPTQAHPHPNLISDTSPFKSTVSSQCVDSFPYAFDATRFLRADIMLSVLYKRPSYEARSIATWII